ncbi:MULTISPECIES: DUF2563 family protein [Mycobacteriaceae]|uniref:DUF2563 family protein n=1 Tax=Mycobacteriaceae TaxID=1762 RepID=UPI001CFB5959|nr:DUF2563 family protein [Mycolicibacterium phocaicum]UCZ60077.1 DUF2563 family protein [Mycolicibacterium phocaicum]
MFVDPALLRMGAAFAQSAGAIAHEGASRFADASISAGIFGDFDDAHDFHRSLVDCHETHATTLSGFRTHLDSLAERTNSAATIFEAQDAAGAGSINAAADSI